MLAGRVERIVGLVLATNFILSQCFSLFFFTSHLILAENYFIKQLGIINKLVIAKRYKCFSIILITLHINMVVLATGLYLKGWNIAVWLLLTNISSYSF